MTALQSRLFAASLVCVTISGCASSGVGTPLPNGGGTKFLLYAPPESELGLSIQQVPGPPLEFVRDPARDNDPARPANTPADYVAFTTLHHSDPGVNYEGDLMTKSYVGLYWTWNFVDDVESWQANTLVLIKQH